MTHTHEKPPASPRGIDLRSLWSRKWLVLSVTLLSLGLGAAYLLVAEDVYEVKTRLFLDNGVDPTKALQPDGREDRYFVGTQAEIVGSPLIIQQALQKAPVTLPPRTDDDLMTFILESLTVSPVVNTQVLSIRYHSQDDNEAERFLKALVDSYKEHLKTLDASKSMQAVELLAEREAELREKLKSLEEKHAEQRRASPLIGQPHEQLAANAANLTAMGDALAAAQVRRIGLQNQLASLPSTNRNNSAVASAVSYREDAQSARAESEASTRLTARRSVRAALAQEAARLPLGYDGEGEKGLAEIEQQFRLAILNKSRATERLGPAHPMNNEVNADVEMWRQLRDDSVRMAIDSLQKRLEVERANEQRLAKLYELEREKAKELDDYLVQERALLSEIARTEKVYDAVFSQLTDTELVNQALSSGRASIVVRDLDGPHLRAEKLWPQPQILLPACALIGLAGGVVVAFAAESRCTRPRDS